MREAEPSCGGATHARLPALELCATSRAISPATESARAACASINSSVEACPRDLQRLSCVLGVGLQFGCGPVARGYVVVGDVGVHVRAARCRHPGKSHMAEDLCDRRRAPLLRVSLSAWAVGGRRCVPLERHAVRCATLPPNSTQKYIGIASLLQRIPLRLGLVPSDPSVGPLHFESMSRGRGGAPRRLCALGGAMVCPPRTPETSGAVCCAARLPRATIHEPPSTDERVLLCPLAGLQAHRLPERGLWRRGV